MILKAFKPIAEITILAVFFLTVHTLLFHFFGGKREDDFHHSILQLYGIFYGFSLIIMTALIIMKRKNIDSVGNTFMLLTCIKMVIAYLFLRPILEGYYIGQGFEKKNFFITFAIFLTIETVVAIRMLNRN